MLATERHANGGRRKVTVFGGDGFLGSHFVDQLIAHGHEVTVFDRFRGGRSKNLSHAEGRFRRVAGELADPSVVAEALEGQDVAAYFICATTPFAAWERALLDVEAEIGSFVRFLGQCVSAGVRKVVFASSGGMVYGPRNGPSTEDSMPRPVNPYGIAKLGQEHLLEFFRVRHGIEADCYRIGNAYGPRQSAVRGQGVVAAWIERMLAGEQLDVYGDSTTVRDYTFAQDIARLMTFSLRTLDSSETFNLGTGLGTSTLELLEMFPKILGRPLLYRIHPRRPSDNTVSILPSTKLLCHFPGFQFQGLATGLRLTFDWARAVRLFRSASSARTQRFLASPLSLGLH